MEWFDTIGSLLGAGTPISAPGVFGAYVERPLNGLDCDVGSGKVAD